MSDDIHYEIGVVARTIHGEAGNQGKEGMQAVAYVIKNRAHKRKITLGNACLEHHQFSYWNKDPHVKPVPPKVLKSKSMQQAIKIATQIVTGRDRKDPTNGATYYYNPKLAHPAWAKKLKHKKKIGDHVFGQLDEHPRRRPAPTAKAEAPDVEITVTPEHSHRTPHSRHGQRVQFAAKPSTHGRCHPETRQGVARAHHPVTAPAAKHHLRHHPGGPNA